MLGKKCESEEDVSPLDVNFATDKEAVQKMVTKLKSSQEIERD